MGEGGRTNQEGERKVEKVSKRGRRESQGGEQRKMERERERRLRGGVESTEKKRGSRYSFQQSMQPLLAALGGPLGQAGGV